MTEKTKVISSEVFNVADQGDPITVGFLRSVLATLPPQTQIGVIAGDGFLDCLITSAVFCHTNGFLYILAEECNEDDIDSDTAWDEDEVDDPGIDDEDNQEAAMWECAFRVADKNSQLVAGKVTVVNPTDEKEEIIDAEIIPDEAEAFG